MSMTPFDEQLAAPIQGDSPVGRDLTYEPHFQALQAEIEQATSLSGRAVDWLGVRETAGRLLREESKDLRLASWWAVAATHVDGWQGFAQGLGLYGALLAQHWDGMFPPAKRAKARAGVVEWTWEGARKALAVREAASADVATLRASLTALADVDRTLAEKLGELAPGIGPLRSLLREKSESVPDLVPAAAPPEVVTAPTPATSAPLAQASASAAVIAPAVEAQPIVQVVALPPARLPPAALADAPAAPAGTLSSDDFHRVTTEWGDRFFSLATSLREADGTAALAYRLARVAAWLTVDAAPDVERGKTFVRGPRADEVREIRGLFDAGRWGDVVGAAESALLAQPFWIDLQYLSYAALERLGPPYAGARASVVRETLGFLERVPGVEVLNFRDGTAFAAPDTIAWLRAKRGTPVVSSSAGADAGSDDVDAIVEQARTGCGDGRVVDALAVGLKAARALPSARSRFRGRLDLAKLAMSNARNEVGTSLLDELLGEIDASLEAWEPALAAEVIAAVLEASSFGAEAVADPRQRLLFRRLLKLDPASALRIGS